MQHFEQTPATQVNIQVEHSRNRHTTRAVSVLDAPSQIDPDWVGVQRVIRVERVGLRGTKPYQETMFYISSLKLDAAGFAEKIRSHWHIENRLHWVKDVVMGEDQAPLCDGHAATNFAIMRTFALNLLRSNGFTSLTKGIRRVSHDLERLFSFFQ
jgi:Transposase DDE domain